MKAPSEPDMGSMNPNMTNTLLQGDSYEKGN